MIDDTIVKQTWFHIYDCIGNPPSKKVRQILDIYTTKDYFCFKKRKTGFSNFNVFCHNIPLTFIDFGDYIRISLGPMEKYSQVPGSKCGNIPKNDLSKYKHVKIDIEFSIINPYFEINSLKSGYDSLFKFNSKVYPEFHLNIPKGMQLDRNSVKSHVFFKDKNKNSLKYCFGNKKSKLKRLKETFNNNNNNNDELIYIHKNSLKNNYTILLDHVEYNKILEKYEFSQFRKPTVF
ncbi:MAG: hypothetical protein ACRC1M_07160 [Methanobacteriaceae archaeon]